MTRIHSFLLAALCLVVPWSFGCGSGSVSTGPTGTPPAIVTTIAANAIFDRLAQIVFGVTATDPDGDPVTLSLLNAPPGAEFPRVGGVASATGTFRWLPTTLHSYDPRLIFRAADNNGNVTLLSVFPRINARGRSARPFQCCDVTGDGIMDVIARASAADIGAADSGALYVFAGASTPAGAPTATLRVSGATAGDMLAALIECCDVNGDGIDDIVASAPLADTAAVDAGGVYVFFGGAGLVGTVSPSATLAVPGATVGDQLAQGGIRCCDVTGDGTRDVLAWSPEVDVGAVVDAGAVYVWTGGAGLSGVVAPTATLRRPAPATSDFLASGGLVCCDVTGDGRRDVLAVSPFADPGGLGNAGAVYMWAGGPGLTGTPPPTASLLGAAAGDSLGGAGVRCCDVIGSGVFDVLVGSQAMSFGAATDAGGVLLWTGGPGLAGTPPPHATLRRSVAQIDDLMGLFRCCDVTGDGRHDVIVYGAFADVPPVPAGADVGEVLVWQGGAIGAGTPAALATLRIPSATMGDRLSEVIVCCDVTGDTVDDLVVGARRWDGAVPDEGAVFVWAGGAGLTGIAAPTARLSRAGAVARDELSGGVRSIVCCDVTGDTIADVVVGSSLVDNGVVDAGGAFVYAGGPGLTGNLSTPTASLFRPAPTAQDRLTGDGALVCCDVTGDGIRDVVISSEDATVSGAANAGILLLWHGGPALSGAPLPTATLQTPVPVMDDRLGSDVYCCDLDADGVLDIMVPAPLKDLGAVTNAGALYWWRGSPALTGTPLPVELTRGVGFANDFFSSFGTPFVCCDITGDGVGDLLTPAPRADVGGVSDAGVIGWWRGGTPPPATAMELAVPGATPGDQLGD